MIHRTNSSEETKQLAADLAGQLKGGEAILLDGDLGAGKTTFVQGLVQALESNDSAHSPTFTIMNIYQVNQTKIKKIVHLDFYRLAESGHDNLGLDEWLGRDDVIIVAEWPPADFNWQNSELIKIQLAIISEDIREITIS